MPTELCDGRAPSEFDLQLDGTRLYCATDGCGVETIDFVTRQRRPSVKADVVTSARLADYLSSIGFYWPMVSARIIRLPRPDRWMRLSTTQLNTCRARR
jgi:trimethylamine:corrinoid methyltransferase-like protein